MTSSAWSAAHRQVGQLGVGDVSRMELESGFLRLRVERLRAAVVIAMELGLD